MLLLRDFCPTLACTIPAGRDKTTRGRHNEGTTRGDATTSWHDEKTPGRPDERQHNLIVVRLESESIGEVAAMVIARIECKPERLRVGDEFQEVGYVVQKGLRARRHLKDMLAEMEHPFVRVLGGPT
jgi:hypothetical protein